MEGMWENILGKHQQSLKSLFLRSKPSSPNADAADDYANSPKPIPQLSPLANSVVSRCSKSFSSLSSSISISHFHIHFPFTIYHFRILGMSPQELQHCFDSELPMGVKELLTYARHLLEFCSYKALHKLIHNSDFLNDNDFRRLTFDMMLAWEAPSVHTLSVHSILPSLLHFHSFINM